MNQDQMGAVPQTASESDKYLKIAGNIHLSYFVEAADQLGISYKIIKPGLLARFEFNGKHWFIINTVTPLTNTPGTTIARRKNLATIVMKDAGIPVSTQAEIANIEQAIDFYRQYQDIVLKPVRSHGGKGVTVLPKNEEEVQEAYNIATNVDLSGGSFHVLAETFAHGINYRLLVLEDKVIGAVRRKPATVVGDGTKTINELIFEANSKRKDLMLKPIPYDREMDTKLEMDGLTVESVPQAGQEVLLRMNCNLTTGGTTEECMSEINPYYFDLAVKACKALGLHYGGVDLIASDITNPNAEHVINEVNFNPGLRVHYKADKGLKVAVAIPIMERLRDGAL